MHRPQISQGALPRRQDGAGLLLLTLMLAVAAGALVLRSHSPDRLRTERGQRITEALHSAKEELIAFALGYEQLYPLSSGPGHLPCPDIDHNGNPDTPCGPTALGRLPDTAPTASLALLFSNYRSDPERRFWYALADPFRDNPPWQKVNSNASMLRVNGSAALAVLMEPGERLDEQRRIIDGVHELEIGNYLEGENADGDTEYAAAGNDRLLAVRPREVYPLLQRLVAREVTDLLRRYRAACGTYPAPAPFADPEAIVHFESDPSGTVTEGLFPRDWSYPEVWGNGCAPELDLSGWIIANDWLRHIYYVVAQTDPCTPGADCLKVAEASSVNDRGQALLIFPGTPLAGQFRFEGTPGLGEYFEGENATPSDRTFQRGEWGDTFNDDVYIVQ